MPSAYRLHLYERGGEHGRAAERGEAVLMTLGLTARGERLVREEFRPIFSSEVLQLQEGKPDYVVEIATTPDFARIIQESLFAWLHPAMVRYVSTATDFHPESSCSARVRRACSGISPSKAALSDDPAVAEYRAALAKSLPE